VGPSEPLALLLPSRNWAKSSRANFQQASSGLGERLRSILIGAVYKLDGFDAHFVLEIVSQVQIDFYLFGFAMPLKRVNVIHDDGFLPLR
jgi:hypothetical protein